MTEKSLARRLWEEEEGGEAVEYGLIIAIVAVAIITILVAFRKDIAKLFGDAGEQIANPPPPDDL